MPPLVVDATSLTLVFASSQIVQSLRLPRCDTTEIIQTMRRAQIIMIGEAFNLGPTVAKKMDFQGDPIAIFKGA
jgi:hypothetical protein